MAQGNNAADVFHVIGYTNQNLLDGLHLRLLGLTPFAKESEQRFRAAVQAGNATVEVFEVYSLSSFLVDDDDDTIPDAISKLVGGPYMEVKFLNDLALKLCAECRIPLPSVVAKITRAELPPPAHLGVTVKGPFYMAVISGRA